MLKASPTSTAQPSSQRRLPRSIAASAAPAAASISRISSGSTALSRETATNDGKTARAKADTSAAARPKRGAISQYRSATESTAQMPSGTIRLSGEKPKSLALSACSQSARGGLSTVMKPLGSDATKKKLCQEPSIDFTAAE